MKKSVEDLLESFERLPQDAKLEAVSPCLVISVPALDQDRALVTLVP
jgi:hypothetical protein